jgi:hypothetical protein
VEIELSLNGEIAMVKTPYQVWVHPRRSPLHIFIRILNGKGAAAFDKILKCRQANFVISRQGHAIRTAVFTHLTARIRSEALDITHRLQKHRRILLYLALLSFRFHPSPSLLFRSLGFFIRR